MSAPGYFHTRTPTVYPADPFDPVADAETLRAAMKGFGTDEKSIVDVLARRTLSQRLEIVENFKTMYGKDLTADIKSETGGNFENVLVALMKPMHILYASLLKDAMSGAGTDDDCLIEVMCTMTNHDIQVIKETYQSEYGNSLEDDLVSDTSGTFRRVMVSMCNASRDESLETDLASAREDAGKLLEAGEGEWGTDESTFNMILCQRNHAQLHLIFKQYEEMSGKDIEDTIKDEFSGNSEDAFLAIVRAIRNRPMYFAKCLHSAIAGMGTDDDKLIRIIVTRSEIDMGDIRDAYEKNYEKSLADAISDDTSGDYKYCLLALVGC